MKGEELMAKAKAQLKKKRDKISYRRYKAAVVISDILKSIFEGKCSARDSRELHKRAALLNIYNLQFNEAQREYYKAMGMKWPY